MTHHVRGQNFFDKHIMHKFKLFITNNRSHLMICTPTPPPPPPEIVYTCIIFGLKLIKKKIIRGKLQFSLYLLAGASPASLSSVVSVAAVQEMSCSFRCDWVLRSQGFGTGHPTMFIERSSLITNTHFL